MPEVIITYETLYEILRKEKTRKELQKLNNNFFNQLFNYLNKKTSILKSQKEKNSPFTSEIEKTEKQIKNIKRMIHELYERRERKITESAIFASRIPKPVKKITENMLTEEKELYLELLNNLKKSRQNILSNLLSRKQNTKTTENEKNSTTLIRILHSVPKFIGTDNFIYGPFEPENIANLPSEIAQILINKKRAEKIAL